MIQRVIARARVILRAAVTWLVVAAVVLTVVADELAGALGAGHPVVVLILRGVTAIGVAVGIIRRVTPVLPAARGLLAPDSGTPLTTDEARALDRLQRSANRTHLVSDLPP